MIKLILPILLFLAIVVSCKQKEPNKRTEFHPKKELIKNNIPEKEDVWVFIMAGQSNMVGRALVAPQDTIPSERVLTINKSGDIIVAKEPIHFYEPSGAGLDCGLSFGKTLVQALPDSISVLLIPTAVGGSAISQWLGDSTHRTVKLLTNFTEKVKRAKEAGQIKGILWHQGEADANEKDILLYRERLSRLFSQFRRIAENETLTIVIGELGGYSQHNENWMKINEQIHLYASADPNAGVISSEGLADKGDKVHFNSEGQRILGERFANEYLRMMTAAP